MCHNYPLFSIITPCYNAEAYLTKCVDSILNQQSNSWELILIDDGSVDTTPIMCDNYKDLDSRIKVIHQRNAGVSAARNHGLDIAKGEWVVFIDSDDWFTEDAFEIFQHSVKHYSADRFFFNRYNYKSRKVVKDDLCPNVLIREKEQNKYFLLDMLFPYYDYLINKVVTGGIRGVNCSLYRRKIIEEYNIRFEENVKIAEDAMFNFDFICHSRSICMQNKYVGYYRIEDSSVMHKFNTNIDEINTNTINGFKKRIEILIEKDEEFKISYLGMLSECVFRGMKLKYVNSLCNLPLKELVKQFKDWFYQDCIQKWLDYKYLRYLPNGKRQIMWCLKHKMIRGAMIISKFSIAYLKFKSKI